MARWVKPEVYPLMAAMGFVTTLCVFQLTRNILINPDVRVNKEHRRMGVLENEEEGEKYAEHSLRRRLAIVQHSLSNNSHLRPSDVCSNLWPRFKTKVLENGSREISKESFESKISEIEIGVICDASKKAIKGRCTLFDFLLDKGEAYFVRGEALVDKSPTSSNLENDHGFIIKE
ncbi:hypothetical protein SDJN02_20067, partial [Cucurbita argyrosperma subsp. argyrosperma]